MPRRRIILFLLLSFAFANSAPLLMLPMEADIDSNIATLWENSIVQILKESSFEPLKIELNRFKECENIECIISAARASGAQGLFRGRLRKQGDSISVRLHVDWLAGNSSPQTDVKGTVPIAWDQTLQSGSLLKLVSAITGKKMDITSENNSTFISVETNPEDAVVMLDGEAVCYSPCTFADSDSIAQIAAYWDSGENIWTGKRTVKLGKDTVKIFLELKRSRAQTELRTSPEEAYIFNDEVLDTDSKAIGKTPYIFRGIPGETQVKIFKKGYNDTLLSVHIDAVEKQIQFVELTPITDLQKIEEQNSFVNSRLKKNIGFGLIGGSISTIITGSILCILAQDDYKVAKNTKNALENNASFGGAHFDAQVNKNHKAAKDGDYKMGVGAGMLGLSVLLAGIGITLAW